MLKIIWAKIHEANIDEEVKISITTRPTTLNRNEILFNSERYNSPRLGKVLHGHRKFLLGWDHETEIWSEE